MKRVFVDTSAWFALYVPDDRNHEVARSWFDTNRQRLVTTDYVLSELLTLLRFRREFRRAIDTGRDLFRLTALRIEWITPSDFDSAWNVFQRFDDKTWSFTDCTSRVVMERLGVEHAFAFDEDFRQFGTVIVVP